MKLGLDYEVKASLSFVRLMINMQLNIPPALFSWHLGHKIKTSPVKNNLCMKKLRYCQYQEEVIKVFARYAIDIIVRKRLHSAAFIFI